MSFLAQAKDTDLRLIDALDEQLKARICIVLIGQFASMRIKRLKPVMSLLHKPRHARHMI